MIKWVKGDKPYYQFSEFIQTGEGRVIPAPPTTYFNLNVLFQLLQNQYSVYINTLLTMNFDEEERNAIDKFISTHSFIIKHKHLSKPAGKKTDGSPFRVFLIDDNMQDIKQVRQILMDEHFEIVGFAKTQESADRFLETKIKHVDLVICEIYLADGSTFDIIPMLKSQKNNILVLIVSKSSNKIDVQKSISLKADGYVIKPVEKESFIRQLRKICNT